MGNNPLWDTSLTDSERLEYLIGELTLEEKLQCLGTGCPKIERLGIEPFYVGGEGAHGVQLRHDQSFDRGEPQPTTIFPCPVGMSATWDPVLIHQMGKVVGTEARAAFEKEGRKGGLCLWAPTIDMERDPRWGRTEEAYGEDSFLTGKMASAYIRGMRGDQPSYPEGSARVSQAAPVRILCGATLKHFYANNVEDGRGWKSSSIDPRNKHEYYLEPFRRAIIEGGAEAVMTSYNEINGIPALINPEIRDILKKQWGLHHVVCDGADMVMTVDAHEYFGSHAETVAAGLKAGMDCFTDDLDKVVEGAREALAAGMIGIDDINRALRCHFRTMLRLGLFDRDPVQDGAQVTAAEEKTAEAGRDAMASVQDGARVTAAEKTAEADQDPAAPAQEGRVSPKNAGESEYICGYGLNLPEHQKLSRKVSAESVVLLKNDLIDGEKLLPLRADRFTEERKLAVIGPSADEWFMDWYSGVPPYHVTPLEGIRRAVADSSGVLPMKAFGEKDTPSGDGNQNSSSYVSAISENLPGVMHCSGNPRFKLACEDKYLGLLPDGTTLGLVDEADAEEFEAVLWDKERMTLRCMSNGKLLMAEDGQEEDESYRKGIFTASKDEAFGWFIKEAFLVSESIKKIDIPEDAGGEAAEDWENFSLEGASPDNPSSLDSVSFDGLPARKKSRRTASGGQTSLPGEEQSGLSLTVGDKFQRILENGSEILMRAWNGSMIYLDEENKVRLSEKNGFIEDGELLPVRYCIMEDGERIEIEGEGNKALCLEGTFETVDGRIYRTLPPVCPVLTHDAIQAAARMAEEADTVIFVGGAHPMVTCKEDVDRTDIDFPPFQRELLQVIRKHNARVVLVMISSVPYAATWEDQHIPAILTMASSGMELGNGLADVLFGEETPAGRLNMTWYRGTDQLPDMDDYDIIQKERTYQYFTGEVLYPFGHGLTYGDIRISRLQARVGDWGSSDFGSPYRQKVQITCTVSNRSNFASDEVIQLYYRKKDSAVKRPERQLVGFERLHHIEPGAKVDVSFLIAADELLYYDTIQQRMLLEPGEYEFLVGRSSLDIDQAVTVSLRGEERGEREGKAWQLADHYDRSTNAYLWEGHMGYSSVAHKSAPEDVDDLMEEAWGLWQNVNEISRSDDDDDWDGDDSMILEYDTVRLSGDMPGDGAYLVIDADGAPDAEVDVYLDGEYMESYVLEEFKRPERKAGRAYRQMDGISWRRGVFRQHRIWLGETEEDWCGTLMLKCHGDIRICRWRFEGGKEPEWM